MDIHIYYSLQYSYIRVYNEPCNGCINWTSFCVLFIHVKLSKFSTLGLYFNLGLYRILFYSGFRIDRFYYTMYNILLSVNTAYKQSTKISFVLMHFLCKTSHKDSCAWPCERNLASFHSWKDGISHTRGRNPRSSIGTRVRIY